MQGKELFLFDDELDTVIDLITSEIEALARGDVSYGDRETDTNEAAHLTNIVGHLKNARDEDRQV